MGQSEDRLSRFLRSLRGHAAPRDVGRMSRAKSGPRRGPLPDRERSCFVDLPRHSLTSTLNAVWHSVQLLSSLVSQSLAALASPSLMAFPRPAADSRQSVQNFCHLAISASPST